jgi:lipopolysaccharide/colanic/teichoic acid biosynthesis glycosyltransferase
VGVSTIAFCHFHSMYSYFKRSADILMGLAGLAILSPVFLFIALWIKTSSRGPVLYTGSRVGRDGRKFGMLKFRSMVVDADQMGASSTATDDPRVTSVGRVMRRFKLDELPQLINVVRGEMSFVGPRPQVQWAVELYSPAERQLLSVRPGITDYASLRFRNEGELLRGSNDPDKAYLELIAPGKISLGLYYVRHCSPATDARIIVATALLVAGLNPSWCLPPETSWR